MATDLVFHILDSFAQDLVIEEETETTREVSFDDAWADEDEESRGRRKAPKRRAAAAAKPREMVLHLFGATAAGKPVRANILGFRPFFFVKLPDDTSDTRNAFRAKMDKALPVADVTFCKRKTLFGFTGGALFPFARISVPSKSAFYNAKKLFLNAENMPIFSLGPAVPSLEVFEANLDPMLRFFHLRNLQPAGWATIAGAEAEEGPDGTLEVSCDWEEISRCESPPAAAAAFLVASWDIECYSQTGEFPLPKRGYDRIAKLLLASGKDARGCADMLIAAAMYPDAPPAGMDPIRTRTGKLPARDKLDALLHGSGFLDELTTALESRDPAAVLGALKPLARTVPLAGDPVIQIGVVLQRGQAAPTRHVFVLGTCAAIPDATVHTYKTEVEMIRGWAKFMRAQNPDILIGYNVFGFDEKYLWERICELGLVTEETEDGRTETICDEDLHTLTRLFDQKKEFKLETKFLSSSALGDNTMYMWSTHGRLQVDLFHYIKPRYQFTSYKLDDVCTQFMSGKLAGVETPEGGAWILQTKATSDVVPGRYVTLLDETADPVVEKLRVIEVRPGKALVVEAPEGDAAADLAIAAATAVKWAVVKDDVPPQEIFKLHRGSAADRARVAAYCIQDCVLVLDLYKKLDVFNNAMAMANACSVPVGYIFTRGQGVKIESLIYKECYERNETILVLPNPPQREEGAGAEESYEGAIVLDPIPGFYFDSPIGVADFASLYPSTIISENISYDTLAWVKDFNLDGSFRCFAFGSDACEAAATAGVRWTDIQFDIWGFDPADKRKHPTKMKTGIRICRYAQYPGNAKGALPEIVQKLLIARKVKRKEADKEMDPFKKALLDAEQLAYKLTANSLYGQLGSGTFKIRLQHLAASVTAYGRKQIMFAKAAIEEFYGPAAGRPDCCADAAQVVYGDSVLGDTPLYLKQATSTPYLQRVDELAGEWLPWHESKEAIDVSTQGLQTWTERGWTPIRRIIRHRLAPGKKLFRILTHTGVVDCTEDHSLVAASGVAIKPSDVTVGTELLHMQDISGQGWGTDTSISKDEAWAMGFFLADGSADVYECPSGMKATWAVNKADTALLREVASHLPFQTKILDTLESSGVYKLVPVGSIKEPAQRYRDLFYNSAREKRVPAAILNAPIDVVSEFMAGFYAGDGDKANGHGYIRWDQKGKEVSAGLFILARRLGYTASLNDRSDKQTVFRITLTKASQRKNPIAIKKIRELPTADVDYVYDLETENHHFGVGPGALVVHNTDSLFVCFNPKNPETGERLKGREAIVKTMELTEEAGKFVTQMLKPPHDFEYDKVFAPFIIFSKKRYVGNKYEASPDDYYQTSMGIATKRRDYAAIVKVIYGGALRILLTDKDITGAVQFVKEKLLDFVNGKMSLNLITMSKSLRAEYKSETPPAHKVLAQRMAARDPGNAPASGDRIPFIYVLPPPGQAAAKLQGDRIETPSYIRANNRKPDYKFYIEHQLMSPLLQLFGLVADKLPGCQPPKNGWGAATEAERDAAVEKALFAEAFEVCDGAAKARFMGLFGTPAAPAASTKKPKATAEPAAPAAAAAKKPALVQPKMSYFMNTMILKSMEKAKKAAGSSRSPPTTRSRTAAVAKATVKDS